MTNGRRFSGAGLSRRYGTRWPFRSPQLTPSQIDLQNWWQPSGIDSGLASTWYDSGPEGADLVQAFANPLTLSIPINGKSSITGVPSSALENASTSMSGAREAWVVIRPNTIASTSRLVYDGLGPTDRQSLFSQTTGNLRANAGLSLEIVGGVEDSRVQILRVVVDGTGTGAIYRITDLPSASTPVVAGTIGSGNWVGITVGSGNAGSNAFQGAICELLRYSALMSPAAVDQTAAYLLAKYPSGTKYNLTPTYLLPLGDSLTQGILSTSGYSYKEKLFYAFEANDVSPTSTLVFNGSIEQECFHHDGVSGDTIAQIEARAAAAISASSADVLVLIAGTNDAQDVGYNGATAESDYASLLATIYAADPTLPIVLCLAPPLTTVSHNANINDLNSRIVSTVVPGASSTIYVVDPRNAGWTTGAGYTTDGVHPNTAGEAALATVIEAGIRLAV